MKHKRKKWLRILLEELAQIAGQNSDMIGKHQQAASELVDRLQSAAHDCRRMMAPDWLIIAKNTKVNLNDISSVALDETNDPTVWRIHMKNGVEFVIPVDNMSKAATKHPLFSLSYE